jgi:hypothetical protein
MPIWRGVWGKTYGRIGSGDEVVVSEWEEDYMHVSTSEIEVMQVEHTQGFANYINRKPIKD